MACGFCGNLSALAVDLPNITSSKCSLENDGCSECKEIKKLQRDIHKTSRKLISLVKRLEETKTAVERSHNIVLNLPTEIITEIFRTAYEGILPCNTERSISRTEEQRSSPKMCLSLKLAAVCQLWRNVALSFPHIWTDIHIALHRQTNEANLAILMDITRRSKCLPLSISIYSNKTVEAHGLYERTILRTLSLESKRWHSLHACFPLSGMELFFDSIKSLPSIHSIHVHSNDEKDAAEAVPQRLWGCKDIKAQRVFLNLLTYGKLDIQWNNVTHVIAYEFSTEQAHQLLRCAPMLESYTLQELYEEPFQDSANFQNSPFVHNKLRHISYRGHIDWRDDIEIFSLNSFPALTSLDYEAHQRPEPEPLIAFIQRSRPQLLELRIRMLPPPTPEDLIRLLSACPSLTHLDFAPEAYELTEDEDYEFDHVFRKLAENNSLADENFVPFLPCLKSLKFTGMFPFPWQFVPGFFGALSDTCRRPLENLQITVYCFDKAGDPLIPEDVLVKLLDLRRAGLRIDYLHEMGDDYFQWSLRKYGLSE